MEIDVLRRLEQRVDQLLERLRGIDAQCQRLQAENEKLLEERETFGRELDRILAKLEQGEESDH